MVRQIIRDCIIAGLTVRIGKQSRPPSIQNISNVFTGPGKLNFRICEISDFTKITLDLVLLGYTIQPWVHVIPAVAFNIHQP